ncbi:MAG: tol-pal system-associated acyl-CoA thioesterase [Alphaproteobacteria bacterium]|nr:tol-pal system-associated acyl-CoA thioesterase [Alphaproteobacteria bacterium]
MAERAPHRTELRVYWEDTDAAGIVYYASYLRFAERGRTEMLRALGVGQRRMAEEQGIAFAVRRCACEYLRPARLDDALVVETSVARAAGAAIEMRQDISRGGELLARLDVTVACIGAGGRPTRLPPALRHALAAFVADPS